MAKLVSKTYGEALFSLAVEEDKSSLFLEEAEGIRGILKENPEFDKMMLHPGIPKQEKLSVVDQVFGGRVSPEMTGFLKIVVQKERYSDLQGIFRYFINKVKEVQKIGIAHVTTAVALSDRQKEQVCKRLLETTKYRTMEMHYQTDPEIIGGMVIRIGDRVVDSSIRSKLNDLTRQLLQIQLGSEQVERKATES